MKGKKLISVIATIMFVIGLALFLFPIVNGYISDIKSQNTIEAFNAQIDEINKSLDDKRSPLDDFYDAAIKYNAKIFENKQVGLKNQYSYREALFDLSDYGLTQAAFGYIEIPKLDLELPIYLGASEENMALGAVHLTYTSLPLDQDNTNCVLAAHRGRSGAQLFRNIDRLENGDMIIIHTPWNKLTYTVYEKKIVRENDIRRVHIQEGKKLLTLSSCHPYTGHEFRYLVFAELTDCSKILK